MPNSLKYWFAAGTLLVAWLLLAWFAGTLLHLQGSNLWVFRAGLALIGIGILGTLLWWFLSKSASKPQPAGQTASTATASGSAEEIDLLVREAESRLQSSQLGRGIRVGNLLAFFLVGDSGSGKTTTIIRSGLEPELLAGQVFQDGSVIPTRAVNLWYGGQALFADAGGALLSDPARWARLIKCLAPAKLRSVVGKGQQAPRAAVVCFDCENFMKQNAAESNVIAVQNLRARLGEACQLLGIGLPVYVLFTKADRLPFFSEYVRNLSNEEAGQILGATLPIRPSRTAGVYADQETQRISAVFDGLFYSLSDKRLEYLPREHDAERLPGVYEFPRQFRKLRTPLVQFLVDLCRPSQLRAGPFLRGFYFTGVRTVAVTRSTPVATPQQPAPKLGYDATGIIDIRQFAAARGPSPPVIEQVPETRHEVEWTFLNHLFSGLLLQDRVALAMSTSSSKVSFWRRFLLASVAFLFLVLSVGFTVSYVRNLGLESDAISAAKAISLTESAGTKLATTEALRNLETLRQALATLTEYERKGAPWSFRWGLYAGGRLYPDVRRVYFQKFDQLLFAQTQAALVQTLNRLPAAPGPADEYDPAYSTLKAYLITTSNHDKSTPTFLAPVLLKKWADGRDVDADRMQLAQKQFEFYSEELRNLAASTDQLRDLRPFATEADALAVGRGRNYLSKFTGVERVYRTLLAEASRNKAPFNFNREFKGSAAVVINNLDVPPAFTKAGWDAMQDALKNIALYFKGDQWVLGDQGSASIDPAALEGQLRVMYQQDYINQWRTFLKNTRILPYRASDLADTSMKLAKLSDNQSPLLALFCVVSQNSSTDEGEIRKAFQPVMSVVPPPCKDKYISPSNKPYIDALVALQVCVDQAAKTTPGPQQESVKSQCVQNETTARLATKQIAQNFELDKEGHVESMVQKLMEDPIANLDAALRPGPPSGKALCAQFQGFASKYPFNSAATTQATIQEVNGFFQPGTGALWSFYDSSLKNLLIRQGTQFAALPGAPLTVNPAFLRFFNQAAGFSDALYPGGSQQPHLAYTLKAYPTEGLQAVSLTIDGQTVVSPNSKQMIWPGPGPQGVVLSGRLGGQELTLLTFDGLWAVFQFFESAERWQKSGSVYTFEWIPKTAGRPMTLAGGRPVIVRLDLDTGGAPIYFQKGYFSGMNCVSNVAR
jgi:type VI secretion system protein ImpL